MDHAQNTAPKKSYAPWYLVGFFVVLAIMDGIFVTIATRTHTGVVTDEAYNRGLAYNETIEAAEAQDALGWQSSVRLDDTGLVFEITDTVGKPLSGASVRAEISRPLEADQGQIVSLNEARPGVYSADIEFPADGQWDARVFLTWQSHTYQTRERLIVR